RRHPGARNRRAGTMRRSADGAHQATAFERIFRHQPIKPMNPSPVPKRGRAAGSGVAATFNSALPSNVLRKDSVTMKGVKPPIRTNSRNETSAWYDGKNWPGVG